MRQPNASRIIILAILGLLLVPAFTPTIPPTHKPPVLVSYNPAPANSFHAPLSSAALISITGATPNLQSISAVSQSSNPSSLKTIQQNALRFINDSSYFPQSETSIAVDPANPDHILGAYNDAKYFFCPYLPLDCGSNVPTSISGFTTSTDGGNTVGKSSEIPNPDLTYAYLVAYGDPSVAAQFPKDPRQLIESPPRSAFSLAQRSMRDDTSEDTRAQSPSLYWSRSQHIQLSRAGMRRLRF